MRFWPSPSWPMVPDFPPEAVSWKQQPSVLGRTDAETLPAIAAAAMYEYIMMRVVVGVEKAKVMSVRKQ
jgi:hypothetical protein